MVDKILKSQERINETVETCNNAIISRYDQTISELQDELTFIIDEKERRKIKMGIRILKHQKNHFERLTPM